MAYTTDADYQEAVYAYNSTLDVYVQIGSGIDSTAADDFSGVEGSSLEMSNPEQIIDAVYTMTPGLATFEGYGIPTAVSAGMVTGPLEATHYPPEAGVWSDAISGSDGTIDWSFTVVLTQEHTSAFSVYTDGPNILSGTATYETADGTSVTADLDCSSEGVAMLTRAVTFLRMTVNVTSIDQSYHHVRVVEVEFGASVSLQKRDMGGTLTVIEELDPTETSAPYFELDFSIINVEGDFDLDNPSTRIGELKIGTPLTLSFTVTSEDGTKYTVPCGRFIVGEHSTSDTTLDISAFDARYPLSEIYVGWSLSTATPLGQSIDDLLTEYGISHLVHQDLYEVYPDTDYTFDDESTLAQDLLHIQQAYAIYCLPDRDGSIHITSVWPGEDYGTVPSDRLYSWPSPKQTTLYNYVSVAYVVTDGETETTYYVERDLRSDTTEGKTILQISGNPLITTSVRATAVLDRIVGRLYTEESETEWTGDPALDLGDSVSIPGLWTQDSPRTYVPIYKEVTYNGAFSERIRCTR